MRAIVLGGFGLVGSHLRESGRRPTVAELRVTSRRCAPDSLALDITDRAAVQRVLHSVQPDVVFLAAADANVDQCERNPDASHRINVEAPTDIAGICEQLGSVLVYYSTDYIFDGRNGPYREMDHPAPICTYGAHKAEAERAIRERLPGSHLILRTTVVYGTEPSGKNFLIRLLLHLRSNTPIRVPVDQVGSPTLANDLAEASWQLVEAGARGTFNVGGPERLSRHEFALAAAAAFALDPAPIVAVTTDALRQEAARPLNAGLVMDKVESALGRRMVGATRGLATLAQSGAL